MATSIVSNSTAATFGNSPQKTGEPVDRLSIYSGKALEFDGVSDYITANPDFLVNSTATTAMTVAVWVNVDDISSNQDVIAVFDTNQNSKFLGNYNGSISFTMYNNDYSDILGQKTDDVVLVEGQWHRIVATYDGSQTDAGFKIYMDGALIASSASNSIFSANLTTDLTIGRTNRTSGTTNDFAGKMSDFQVWDTVWSLADVTYDYLNPEKLISSQTITDDLVSNLRVWYPMNDTGITNPQTVIFDAAGTNNTTKAHGTTTFLGDDLFGKGNPVDDNSDWSAGTGWVADAGNSKLTGTSTTANINATNTTSVSDGDVVSITFTVSNYSAGSVRFIINGNTNGTARDADGTYTEEVTISNTAGGSKLYFDGVTAFTGDISDITLKKVGIATGWTDADQQQYIPQTALMDGCLKLVGPENNASNASPHFTLDSTGTTTSGTAYSVSTWLMRTTTPGATDNYLLSTTASHDRIYFPSATQVGWLTDGTGTTINLGVTLEANVWEFWTFVSDGGTKRIYRNAQELATSSQSPSNGFDYSHIGVYGASESATCFEGIIDELAIWDTVLSPTEVTELYNNGLPLNATKHSKYTTSASNLKAYWKNNHLNSDGKMKDQVGSNHATITETGDSFEKIFFQQGVTANLCTQGYSNNIVHPSKGSIHFLGQEYAQFPGERIINLDGDFTIEFWFKKTEIHGGELTDGMIFRSGNNQIRLPSGVSSGKMSSLKYRDAGVNSTFSIHSDNRKSIYEWSHFALVKESGTLKVYIDTATTGNGTLSSTGQMQISLIGAYSISAGQVYKGFLDDLRVYDKALSAAEIAKNYKNGKSQHKNS